MIYYIASMKTALLFTHLNVNWPSKKLTTCVIGLPHRNKIDVILHMDHPWNASEQCMFIGCVNYYQDMLPNFAHILKPLTDHSGLKMHGPILWTPDIQILFDKIQMLMAADALTAYLDHNKCFNVYSDASDYQLGACIVQEGQPVTYFSLKL
ncbi:hypothetical protein ACHAW6_001843 [Cyclotella cf. meneghiniana]